MSIAAGMNPGIADSVGLAGRKVVASYTTYGEAQRAVDHLSDSSFPVEQTSIIGRDLSLVEQVTGRMTKTRAAAMGAVAGAWFGLFIGLFVGMFTTGPGLAEPRHRGPRHRCHLGRDLRFRRPVGDPRSA